MTTEQKPTPKQIEVLCNKFTDIFQKIATMVNYHNTRMNFFKKWNLWSKIIDAVVGIGGLVLVGLYSDRIVSFGVAGFAVFLLFLTVIFDFSKKEETHRWIVSSYMNFEKVYAKFNIEDWENLSGEDYERYKNIFFDITETINNLRKEEFPILHFLHFFSHTLQKQDRGEDVSIVSRIKWWQFLLANYFSMPNALMTLIEKFNAEERQKQKQQQQKQPNKDNKDKQE